MFNTFKTSTIFLSAFACIALFGTLLLSPNLGGTGVANASRPINPQRAMRARNCHQALRRLREAAQGSPIIDAKQNKDHLLKAVAQVERLCGVRTKNQRRAR